MFPITKHRSNLTYGATIPQDWLDAFMEFVSTFLSPNAVVNIISGTVVQIPGGTDNAQVAVAINGRWRYNTANVNATHPGGAAGTYVLWATAADNSFTIGPPEVDTTNYAFAIQILPVASTPVSALSRAIGSVVWTGSAITDAYLLNDFPTDDIAAVPSLRTLGAGAQQAAAGTAPAAAVAAIPADAAVGTPSLRTIGTGAQQASPGTEAASRVAGIAAEAVARDAAIAAAITAIPHTDLQAAFQYQNGGSPLALSATTAKFTGLTQLYDNVDDMANVASQRIDIKRAGTYRIRLEVGIGASVAYTAFLKKNGSTTIYSATIGVSAGQTAYIEWFFPLLLNDFVEAWYTSASGQNVGALTGLGRPADIYMVFQAEYVGA